MRNFRATALVLAGALMSANANAADDNDVQTENDLRCVMVGMRMESSDNTTLRAASLIATMYYLGRLDGRTPKLDLESRIEDEIVHMQPEDYKAAALRCGKELQERGDAITELGNRLIEHGRKLLDRKNHAGLP